MCVIKLYKTEQLYEISTVNVQTSMNKLLWYMYKLSTVYIKYTHLSLSYCLRVYKRWRVCVWRNDGKILVNVATSDRILFSEKGRISCMKSAITCMYMYHIYISDRYILSLNKLEVCRYCHFSFATFLFRQQGFIYWEMKNVWITFKSSLYYYTMQSYWNN